MTRGTGRTRHMRRIELIGWTGTPGELAMQLHMSEEALLGRLAAAGIDTATFPIRVHCHIYNPRPLFQALWRKVETTDKESFTEYRCWIDVSD